MERIAVVATADRLRETLVAVADQGSVEPESSESFAGPAELALRRARPSKAVTPVLLEESPDLAVLVASEDIDAIAGEAQLERVAACSIQRGKVAAIAGWAASDEIERLSARLGPLGSEVVRLPTRGLQPPTLVRGQAASAKFQPLVDTYATVPYRDLNPSLFAGLSYITMFGMMFADVGHGLVLFACGLLLSKRRPQRMARYARAAPFVIGAGAASVIFGLCFGEAFGPTHLVPTLWMAPLDHTTTLLKLAIIVGAALLGISHVLACLNRFREGQPLNAAIAAIAASVLYLGVVLGVAGWYFHLKALLIAGAVVFVAGVLPSGISLYSQTSGKAMGLAQTGIELLDAVVRLGTNTISFTRIAAFGLTHAALGSIIWTNTVSVSHKGALGWCGAVILFVIGNVVTFALEALVCAIQAVRLEYYELFSRIFLGEGHRFSPWHVPSIPSKETWCSTG
jgi:V/A-type H+-transporting ATPase subunit I